MNARRLLHIFLIPPILLAALAGSVHAASASSIERSVASYFLLVNGESYRAKNPDAKRAPASLTKIMTALVVMEKCPMDAVVTVTDSAARESGSLVGLRKGDRLRVRDLLAAMLLASGNDAAHALADFAAGNQKAFAVLMNRRAKSMDLHNTKFTNASGHDDAGHYSSAHDLAVLTEEALRNPVFCDLVSRHAMRVSTINGKRTFWLINKNRMVGRYAGVKGVKTGTTHAAGQCLVVLAEREGTRVLLVLMHAQNRWRAAPALLDQAFAERREAALKEKKTPAQAEQKVAFLEKRPTGEAAAIATQDKQYCEEERPAPAELNPPAWTEPGGPTPAEQRQMAQIQEAMERSLGMNKSAMAQTGGKDEASPEGIVVRDQEKAQLSEHHAASPAVSHGKRHQRRASSVQRHAHHRKRVHKRR